MVSTVRDRLNSCLSVVVYVALLMGLVLAVAPPLSAQTATEYQLRAAFVYNFAKFVEWPPRVFASSTAPFTLCVYEKGPVADALEQGVAGKTVQNRMISVKAVATLGQSKGCQVLYFDQTAGAHLGEMLSGLEAEHVLTVGETDKFTKAGGIIGFIMESGMLRFGINNAAARKSGLEISSKLLSLAKQVED